MQINSLLLLQLLFVLSTIVLVTNCCSSKIIPMKEHTLNIVYQKQQQEQQHQRQQLLNQAEQSVNLDTETNFGRYANNNNYNYSTINKSMIYAIDAILVKESAYTINTESSITPTTTMDTTTISRAEEAANLNGTKFQMIDFYYTIMRDVLSFECNGPYLTDFCLNRGRCFRYPVGNHSFFSCECADGFIGERCESKSPNDFPVPHRAKRSIKKIFTARAFFSFPTLIILSTLNVLIGLLVILRNPVHQQDAAVSFKHVRGDDSVTMTAVIS